MAGFLQASGNPISMSQINSVFDGRGNNLNAYRGTTWFTAAGGSGTFPSTPISFSDFYLKGPSAARTFSLTQLLEIFGEANSGGTAYAEYQFNGDGTIVGGNSQSGSFSVGNWTTPTTAGIGSSYWVRCTQTSSSGPSTQYGNSRGVWHQISGAPVFGVSKTANGLSARVYTFEIASDSGGSNIVATKTGVQYSIEIIF
jgi:hypothetical protein